MIGAAGDVQTGIGGRFESVSWCVIQREAEPEN